MGADPHTPHPRVHRLAVLLRRLALGASVQATMIGDACSPADKTRDCRKGQPRYTRSRSSGPRSSGGAWTVQERWLLKGGRWMLDGGCSMG